MLAVPILNNSTCQPNSTHVLPPLVQVVPEQEPLAVRVKVLEVGAAARDHVALPYDVQEDLPFDVGEGGLHAVVCTLALPSTTAAAAMPAPTGLSTGVLQPKWLQTPGYKG